MLKTNFNKNFVKTKFQQKNFVKKNLTKKIKKIKIYFKK